GAPGRYRAGSQEQTTTQEEPRHAASALPGLRAAGGRGACRRHPCLLSSPARESDSIVSLFGSSPSHGSAQSVKSTGREFRSGPGISRDESLQETAEVRWRGRVGERDRKGMQQEEGLFPRGAG